MQNLLDASRFLSASFIVILVTFIAAVTAQAQSCNPAVVSLVVRDAKGEVLSEADLKSVAATLPKEIGDADLSVGEVSIAPDNKTFYWPESTDWPKGQKMPALEFANASTCTMELTEATLNHKGQTMRLIFNIKIERATADRRPVIEAPKFQNGTFQLDLTTWSHARNELIPATFWKKQ
jgi:hypothetical protein